MLTAIRFPSSSFDTFLEVAGRLEQLLMAFPGVTHASSRIGCAELGGGPEFVSIIEIYVGLKPRAEWTTASDRSTLPEKMEQVLSARLGAAVFSPSR